MKKLLLLFFAFTMGISNAQTCDPPTALTVSTITDTSALISWLNVLPTSIYSEILVLPAGSPSPQITSVGMPATVNPFFVTGLNCATVYDVYVRDMCDQGNPSIWIGPVTFSTMVCAGQPIDLLECVNESTGLACFDVTINNYYILGNLDPALYTVNYYLTEADANIGANPLPIATAVNYCFSTGGQSWAMEQMWSRLTETSSGMFWVYPFNLSAQTTVTNTSLSPLVECDEDADGQVIFDITVVESEINTTNPIAYYSNIEDATSETNPITNPSALSHNTFNPTFYVFIRETIADNCDPIYMLTLNALSNCNVANVCLGANSLCNSLGVPFNNNTNTAPAPSQYNYGCLGSQPNPTWFYLPVSSPGNINLVIQQSMDINVANGDLDVDYIVWGPFSGPTSACSGQLTQSNIVSCSFSTAATEYPIIPNAQTGQFYMLMVTNYSNIPGYIKISALGASQGEIDCSGIRLNAFLDSNANGLQDATELNFPLGNFTYERNNDGDVHFVSSPNGAYNIYENDPAASYDVSYSIDPAYAGNYALATSSYSDLNVIVGAGMQEYNFPITVTQNYNDLSVAIVPNQAPRPGFTYDNKIVYTNLGTQAVANGTVTFTKDPLVTITNVSQSGTVSMPGGFTYDFTNLLPFESREIMVTMQVPTIPTVSLGNLLTNSVSIVPLTGDVAPINNDAMSAQIIIGSYDPNDKMESRGEQILITDFTSQDYLYYTIRFENLGTAAAINVRVTDVLDPALDPSTIGVIDASHNYVLDRVDNSLTWTFEEIMLPATSQNPMASHGYIHFRVKPLPGYAVGDIIPNTASVFFDFNPAVITNTFNSEFVSQLAVAENNIENFVVYPNPATSNVMVSLSNNSENISSVAVYDMLGKRILLNETLAPSVNLDVSQISSGVYFLEITGEDKTKATKKLIIE